MLLLVEELLVIYEAFLGLHSLSCELSLWSKTLATRSNTSGRPVPSIGFIQNIPLLKPLKTIFLPSKSADTLLRVSFLKFLFLCSFHVCILLKIHNSN